MLTSRQQQQQQAQSLFTLTNGKKYNPDAVYADSTDGRGHYEQVRVKITPSVEHLMAQVVAEHPEFRSVGDFIRNAIFHKLHTYIVEAPEPDPRLVGALEAERTAAMMAMAKRIDQSHTENMEAARDAMDICIQNRDWDGLNEVIAMMDEQASDPVLPTGLQLRYEAVGDDGRAAMISELKTRKRNRDRSES